MTNRDSQKFAELCALMSQAFDKQMSEALMLIYFDGLKDFSIEQVGAAVTQAIRTQKFMPKVAELRQLVEGVAEDRAAGAWAAFLEAAANGGNASVRFSDPAAASAMDAVFGGWIQACRLLSAGNTDERGRQVGGCSDEMLASYQKSFLRQYVAALNARRDVELYRPGLSEMSMREQGAAWAVRMPILRQPVLFVGAAKTLSVELPFDVAAGQLTAEARLQLAADWNDVKALVAVQRPSDRKALSAGEPAKPEEIAEEKAKVQQFITKFPSSRRLAEVVNIAEARRAADE